MPQQRDANTLSAHMRRAALLILILALVGALSGCSVRSFAKGLISPKSAATATTKLTPKIKPPAIREAGKLYIGVNLGMAPFAAQTASGYEGFDVDLGDAIARHLGLEPVFVATTPDSMTDALNSNQIDMALSAPAEVPGLVVAQVYYQDAQALFAQSGEASAVASTPRLPKTALQAGSAAELLLASSMPSVDASATLQPYPELSAAIEAVEKQQAVALAGDYVVLHYAQMNGAKIQFVRPLNNANADRGVAIRSDNLDLMRQLKPLLVNLNETGALASIMRSWIGNNELTTFDD